MELAQKILLLFLSMTSSFYISAAVTAIMQCFFDRGIVWSRQKAAVLGVYVLLSELAGAFLPENSLLGALTFLIYIIIPIYDCKGKRLRRALKIVTAYFVVMLCVVCILLIAFTYFLPGYDPSSSLSLETELFIVTTSTALVFGAVFHYLKCRLISRDIFAPCGKKEKFILFFYVISVFTIFTALTVGEVIFDSWPRKVESLMVLVSIFLMLLFPVFVFHSRISDQYRRLYERQQTYLEAELEHFRSYRDAQEETARFRHDIRNNLACLEEMLGAGKTEEAAEYLSGLLQTVRGLSPKYVSGDEVLDCIISSKASSMERAGVDFALDGVIAGGLGWSAIEVCGVFANALDNAAEACARLPREQRKVTMTLKTAEQFRFVRIENPVAKPVDVSRLFSENGYTTKRAPGKHGIGTYNMKRIVERHGGMIKASCEDGIFALELVIRKEDAA